MINLAITWVIKEGRKNPPYLVVWDFKEFCFISINPLQKALCIWMLHSLAKF
jgi:hypothetical protein